MVKVIYIAGFSYCGSTLLDVLFSSMDGAVGLGEVSRAEEEKDRRYFRIEELDEEYKKWWNYALWGDLYVDLKDDSKGGWLSKLQGGGGLFGGNFFKEAKKYFDADYVVDSSKTTPRNVLRPKYLMGDGVRVLIVHSVRNPVSLIESYYRKGVGNPVYQAYVLLKWVASSLMTYFLYRNDRYCLVRYDTLMEDPIYCLDRIGVKLSIDVEGIKNRIKGHKPFEQGGGFVGNSMRRSKKIYFNPPKGRRRELPTHLKLLGMMCLPFYYYLTSSIDG